MQCAVLTICNTCNLQHVQFVTCSLVSPQKINIASILDQFKSCYIQIEVRTGKYFAIVDMKNCVFSYIYLRKLANYRGT